MFAFVMTVMAPAVALLCYVYLRDDDQHDMPAVIRMFVVGALLVVPISVLQHAFGVEGFFVDPFSQSFFLYGFMEEGLKWLMLFIFSYQHGYMKHLHMGILLGLFLSLGFATVENGLYFIAFGVESVWLRMFPIAFHAIFGVVMGYYLAKAAEGKKRRLFLYSALFIPSVLHGMYDLILKIFSDDFLFIMIPFMVLLFLLVWWKLNQSRCMHDV